MPKITEYIHLLTGTALTQRQIIAHRFGVRGARPKAYIQASLHADEIPGMLVAHHLLKLLDQADQKNQIRGEIVVIPVANPIGLSQFMNAKLTGRYELGGGGNFNRNWPDLYSALPETIGHLLTPNADRNIQIIRQGIQQILDQAKPFSEMSSLKLTLARLAFDSDFVLDLHCDDEALMHLFLTPAHWPDATDLAAELGSYASLLSADSGGQSFDESLSTPWIKLATDFPNWPIPAACMAATVEHRGSADVNDELALKDAQGIFRFLQRRQLVAGNPGALPPLLNQATDFTACDIIKAPTGGIVVYRKRLGEPVKKGEVIAEIVDPVAIDSSQARIPVVSVTDGFILSRRLDHFLRPSDTVAKVVGKIPLPHRNGLLLED
jgi:predicted deacylase